MAFLLITIDAVLKWSSSEIFHLFSGEIFRFFNETRQRALAVGPGVWCYLSFRNNLYTRLQCMPLVFRDYIPIFALFFRFSCLGRGDHRVLSCALHPPTLPRPDSPGILSLPPKFIRVDRGCYASRSLIIRMKYPSNLQAYALTL